MKDIRSMIIASREYRGYTYIIRRLRYVYPEEAYPTNTEWYCGYAVIPPDDRLYEINESNEILEEFNVHGGISFTGQLEEVGDAFLIGFDCNHARDDIHEQDIFYVDRECKNLIDQIIELNKEYKVSFNIFMRDKKSKDEVEKMIEQALSETIGKNNTVFAFNIEVE